MNQELMGMHPMIAVRAIITNEEGKVLILKRAADGYSPGQWNLPGGKVEFNETAEAAVMNEVLEETGLQVSACSFFSYLDGLPNKENPLHFITLIFTCSVSGSIKLNGESSDYTWIGPEEMGDVDLAFRNGDALRMYWAE